MKQPDASRLYGIAVSGVTAGGILDIIDDRIVRKIKTVCYPLNIHILVELVRHPDVLTRILRTDIVFADGVPIVWLCALTGHALPGRVSGTDLVERLLSGGRRCYLVGATPDILDAVEKRFGTVGGGGGVCGQYSPPFGPAWNDRVDREILADIRRSGADIVLVGVGPLKQERWIQRHSSEAAAPVWIPVGSAFDILSGYRSRAPIIIKDIGLEWLWRLMQEPRRLIPRYVGDLLGLAGLIIGNRRGK